jgi:hypothetical protein
MLIPIKRYFQLSKEFQFVKRFRQYSLHSNLYILVPSVKTKSEFGMTKMPKINTLKMRCFCHLSIIIMVLVSHFVLGISIFLTQ